MSTETAAPAGTQVDKPDNPASARPLWRSMGDSPWAWFSKAAHDRALSAGQHIAGHIYIGLAICQSDAASRGKVEFFASISNVSRACGVPPRTIIKYIPLLEKCGLVRRISGRHGGENGAHCANRWMLLAVSAPGAKAHRPRKPKLMPATAAAGANKKEVQGLTDLEQTSSAAATSGAVAPDSRGEVSQGATDHGW